MGSNSSRRPRTTDLALVDGPPVEADEHATHGAPGTRRLPTITDAIDKHVGDERGQDDEEEDGPAEAPVPA